MIGPATIIYCFAWRGGSGFQRFTLQEVYWTLDENKKEIMKPGEKFTVEYVDPEELQGRFLYFLSQHTNDLWKWNVWVEAFVSLFFGGPGAQFAPGWRYRQLQKKHEQQTSTNNNTRQPTTADVDKQQTTPTP